MCVSQCLCSIQQPKHTGGARRLPGKRQHAAGLMEVVPRAPPPRQPIKSVPCNNNRVSAVAAVFLPTLAALRFLQSWFSSARGTCAACYFYALLLNQDGRFLLISCVDRCGWWGGLGEGVRGVGEWWWADVNHPCDSNPTSPV